GVPESLAKPCHCCVQPVFELYVSIGGPQFSADLLSRYEFAWSFQQHVENLKRLLLQLYPHPVLAQLSGLEIHFKGPETDHRGGLPDDAQHLPRAISAILASSEFIRQRLGRVGRVRRSTSRLKSGELSSVP